MPWTREAFQWLEHCNCSGLMSNETGLLGSESRNMLELKSGFRNYDPASHDFFKVLIYDQPINTFTIALMIMLGIIMIFIILSHIYYSQK